jgi:hypothetical protein
MVIAAPLPVGLKFVNVPIHCAAVLPVFRGVVVDPSSIGLKAPMAIRSPVLVAKSGLAHGQCNCHRQRQSENNPRYLPCHESSPEI